MATVIGVMALVIVGLLVALARLWGLYYAAVSVLVELTDEEDKW